MIHGPWKFSSDIATCKQVLQFFSCVIQFVNAYMFNFCKNDFAYVIYIARSRALIGPHTEILQYQILQPVHDLVVNSTCREYVSARTT